MSRRIRPYPPKLDPDIRLKWRRDRVHFAPLSHRASRWTRDYMVGSGCPEGLLLVEFEDVPAVMEDAIDEGFTVEDARRG